MSTLNESFPTVDFFLKQHDETTLTKQLVIPSGCMDRWKILVTPKPFPFSTTTRSGVPLRGVGACPFWHVRCTVWKMMCIMVGRLSIRHETLLVGKLGWEIRWNVLSYRGIPLLLYSFRGPPRCLREGHPSVQFTTCGRNLDPLKPWVRFEGARLGFRMLVLCCHWYILVPQLKESVGSCTLGPRVVVPGLTASVMWSQGVGPAWAKLGNLLWQTCISMVFMSFAVLIFLLLLFTLFVT